MSALPYHKRYHGDALHGFMALTLEERGAYQTILDLIYDRGGPIADDERLLSGYMKCSIRKWRSVRLMLMEKGKIALDHHGLITNKRAIKEIENVAKTHRKLVENGSKGGRVSARIREIEKNGNENNGTEQAGLEPGSSDAQAIRADSRSQKLDTDSKESAQPDPEKVLFDLGRIVLVEGGLNDARARGMIGKWRKEFGDEAVLSALAAAQEGRVSEPLSWIRKRLVARGPGGGGPKPFFEIVLDEAANREREKAR